MSFKWIAKYTLGILLPSLRKYLACKNTKFLKAHSNSFLFLDKLSRSYWDIKDLQTYEIEHTNLPVLLRYEDKNSMRHSIETRLPFIDYKTLENALNINIEYKIKDGWTKYILRRTIDKILPNSIVWRKNKFGFEAPTKCWIDAIDSEIIEAVNKSIILSEILNAIDFKKLDLTQKWKLFNIAKWDEIYNVSWRKKC